VADNPQAGLKDRDMQAYYEALIEMHATPGWKYLTEDMQRIYDIAITIEGIETMEQLNFRRGQIDIIKLLVAHPAVVAAQYDMMLEEENEPLAV